jgi:hypothetical protein
MVDISILPTPFELWASSTATTLPPPRFPPETASMRIAARRKHMRPWQAGASSVARMLTDSTIDTEALREKIRGLAGSE